MTMKKNMNEKIAGYATIGFIIIILFQLIFIYFN